MDEEKNYIDYLTGDQMRLLRQVQIADQLTVRAATRAFLDLRTLERKGYLTSQTGRSGWMYYSLTAQGLNVLGFNDPISDNEPEPDLQAEIVRLQREVDRLTKALTEIAEWDVGFSDDDDDAGFEAFFSVREKAAKALKAHPL